MCVIGISTKMLLKRRQEIEQGRKAVLPKVLDLPNSSNRLTVSFARATCYDTHLGKSLRIEKDGELKPAHTICELQRHHLQDSICHLAGFGRSLGLAKQFVCSFITEVTLHQKHSLLNSILPFRVDLGTS